LAICLRHAEYFRVILPSRQRISIFNLLSITILFPLYHHRSYAGAREEVLERSGSYNG
jgi:hypothetical protein